MTAPTNITKDGFRFEFYDRTMGLRRTGKGVFRAPYIIQYEGEFEPRPNSKPDDPVPVFNLTTILLPMKPGWSRAIIFGGQTRRQGENDDKKTDQASGEVKKKKKRRKSRMQLILSILPTWALHQFSNRFLDSDLAFLHYQEQERERRAAATTGGGGGSSSAYFLPAQCKFFSSYRAN